MKEQWKGAEHHTVSVADYLTKLTQEDESEIKWPSRGTKSRTTIEWGKQVHQYTGHDQRVL